MDGIALAREIRAVRGAHAAPVLMLLSSTGQLFASAHADAGFAAQLSKRRDGHPDRNARVNDVESQAWLPNVLARINDYQRGGRAFPLPNRPGTAARQPAPARASLSCRRQAVSAAGRRQAFALVVKWATARSNNNGLPILIVEVS